MMKGGVDISEIMLRCDAINKSVPTPTEFESAITKFQKAELLKIENGLYVMLPHYNELINNPGNNFDSVFLELDKLHSKLNELNLYDNKPDFEFKLQPQAYEEARKKNDKVFHELMDKIKRGEI
ncbi:MAG: hypothetical protein H7Y00_06255 [Fimbriimonadaceae bacterium]|nr:hypothetical protein [Chitinophagales bacterium]